MGSGPMMSGLARRMAGLAATLVTMMPSKVDARTAALQPGPASSASVSESVAGAGAVGGVAHPCRRTVALDPDPLCRGRGWSRWEHRRNIRAGDLVGLR
jgi:hypothetical protein